jgi:NTE family protein
MMNKNKLKIALALGGGGVRGLAHIGVIKTLEKHISIDMIAGTSMGAMVGAQYVLNPDIKSIEKKMLSIMNRKEIKEIENIISGYSPEEEKKVIIKELLTFFKRMVIFNIRAIKRWVFSGKEIDWIFEYLGIDTDFRNAKFPFCCTSMDLRTGDEIISEKGSIKQAVLASISLPGVFPPVKVGERLLVDGGIIGSVPVDAARAMGADIVIAVGVEAQVDYNKTLGNGMDIMFQADAIRAYWLSDLRIKGADIVIYPNVGKISWAAFSQAKECIKAGEQATEKIIPQILELIKRKKRRRFWKKFLPFSKK